MQAHSFAHAGRFLIAGDKAVFPLDNHDSNFADEQAAPLCSCLLTQVLLILDCYYFAHIQHKAVEAQSPECIEENIFRIPFVL